MKVTLALSAGFCSGVRRAIKIALETAAQARSLKRVYMLGDIVHNERVVQQIKDAGIVKTDTLRKKKNSILLLRAHGACRQVIAKAARLGYTVVDATCPMVKEIHRIAQDMEARGYRIIIIGDKNHDEVHGIKGQLRQRALVVENASDIRPRVFAAIKKAAVVVQSTQNAHKVIPLVEKIQKLAGELKFFNTICRPTRVKQEEIRRMPLENDVMIVIGSKTSANTRRLYEISKNLNGRTYWVESKKAIKADWFKNARSVGVTAGASTPDITTREIVDYLKTL
ncbi:MAG: 4-hydroxy-3-methylbut-2-enyl diphosphate reductase [Candidatus Omnitrophica bacterium]|nr:4-hydroxy-3-methylbut-2-enyl diphosphate reductase [Candidatus Omnitrophota bacterium]